MRWLTTPLEILTFTSSWPSCPLMDAGAHRLHPRSHCLFQIRLQRQGSLHSTLTLTDLCGSVRHSVSTRLHRWIAYATEFILPTGACLSQ